MGHEAPLDFDEWRWGRLHYLSLRGAINVDELRGGNWAYAGGENTVARADFEFSDSGFQVTHGQLMRMVVELTEDGPETYLQIIAGLSSLPGSAYYNNLNEQFFAGEPVSIPFTIDEANHAAVEIIDLLPEE